MKNVLVLTGAGQIGLAIVRSIGSGMKIVVSDKSAANAASAALLLNNAGFDAVEHSCDISSKESVAELIKGTSVNSSTLRASFRTISSDSLRATPVASYA